MVSLAIGLMALLGVGGAVSQLRLHPLGGGVWGIVALILGALDVCQAPRGSQRRFVGAGAIAVALIALAAVALVLISFAPCGARCLQR